MRPILSLIARSCSSCLALNFLCVPSLQGAAAATAAVATAGAAEWEGGEAEAGPSSGAVAGSSGVREVCLRRHILISSKIMGDVFSF